MYAHRNPRNVGSVCNCADNKCVMSPAMSKEHTAVVIRIDRMLTIKRAILLSEIAHLYNLLERGQLHGQTLQRNK